MQAEVAMGQEKLAGQDGEDLWSAEIQLLHFGSEETEAMVTKPVSDKSQAQVS